MGNAYPKRTSRDLDECDDLDVTGFSPGDTLTPFPFLPLAPCYVCGRIVSSVRWTAVATNVFTAGSRARFRLAPAQLAPVHKHTGERAPVPPLPTPAPRWPTLGFAAPIATLASLLLLRIALTQCPNSPSAACPAQCGAQQVPQHKSRLHKSRMDERHDGCATRTRWRDGFRRHFSRRARSCCLPTVASDTVQVHTPPARPLSSANCSLSLSCALPIAANSPWISNGSHRRDYPTTNFYSELVNVILNLKPLEKLTEEHLKRMRRLLSARPYYGSVAELISVHSLRPVKTTTHLATLKQSALWLSSTLTNTANSRSLRISLTLLVCSIATRSTSLPTSMETVSVVI